MTKAKLPPELLPEAVFDGKFRIECLLGSGGMGVVLLARHVKMGQDVALKVLLPSYLDDKDLVARFLREGRAAGQIRGDHVCRIFDVAESKSGLPYLVMELLVGRSLEEISEQEGPLAIGRAVDYVLQACEAVTQAHAMGIVHRDIKPANLFLTHTPEGAPLVKVLDFGIAKMSYDESTDDVGLSTTRAGSVMGSPMYMAPEQMKSAADVDPRTDIWAFGAVLYKLIAGQPPFSAGSVPELFASVLHDPAPRVSSMRPDVPDALDDAIHRCLMKDRAQRFATLDELAAVLAPFASSAALGKASLQRIALSRVMGQQARDAGAATLVDAQPEEVLAATRVEPPAIRTETSWTDVNRAAAPVAPAVTQKHGPSGALIGVAIAFVAVLGMVGTVAGLAWKRAHAATPVTTTPSAVVAMPESRPTSMPSLTPSPPPLVSTSVLAPSASASARAPSTSSSVAPAPIKRPRPAPQPTSTTADDRHG